MRVDPSILRTHCVFSAYPDLITCLGELLKKESTQQGTHNIQIDGVDFDVMTNLEKIECVDGDAVMKKIMKARSIDGRKIDVFLGVFCSADAPRVLAIECKLNVQAGKTLNNCSALFEAICEKYWTARCVIEESVPFVGKCYVLFANPIFELALRAFRKAKIEQPRYNIINVMTPKMLEDSLDY